MMPDPEKIYVQVENAVERRRRHHIAEDNKEVITSLMSFDQWFTFKHPTHRDTTLYGVNVVLKSGSPEMEPETKRLITACGYNVRPSTNYFKKLQPPPDDHQCSAEYLGGVQQYPPGKYPCYTIWMNPKPLLKKKAKAAKQPKSPSPPPPPASDASAPQAPLKSNMEFRCWKFGDEMDAQERRDEDMEDLRILESVGLPLSPPRTDEQRYEEEARVLAKHFQGAVKMSGDL